MIEMRYLKNVVIFIQTILSFVLSRNIIILLLLLPLLIILLLLLILLLLILSFLLFSYSFAIIVNFFFSVRGPKNVALDVVS